VAYQFKPGAKKMLREINDFGSEPAFLEDIPELLRTLVPSAYNRPSNPDCF
jgi:hypothetical protein